MLNVVIRLGSSFKSGRLIKDTMSWYLYFNAIEILPMAGPLNKLFISYISYDMIVNLALLVFLNSYDICFLLTSIICPINSLRLAWASENIYLKSNFKDLDKQIKNLRVET